MKKLEELPLLACFDAELLTNSSITQALEIYFPSESRCGRPFMGDHQTFQKPLNSCITAKYSILHIAYLLIHLPSSGTTWTYFSAKCPYEYHYAEERTNG